MNVRTIAIALLLTACASETSERFAVVRPHQPAFCSENCTTAHALADCDDRSVDSASLDECLDSCGPDPELRCVGGNTLIDFECLVACASMEPQATQDALLSNLGCEYPSECR